MTTHPALPHFAPAPAVPLATGPACPARLRALIEAGAPLLIQARVSGSAGQANYKAAVANLFTAAGELAGKDVFPNLVDLLPSKQSLITALRDHSDVRHSEDVSGEPFENRFLTLATPACEQVHLHLSCGSARKVDTESMHQPVALHAASYIRALAPAVVCAAEVARWSRSGWSLHPWALELEALETQLGGPVFLSFDGGTPEPFTVTVQHTLFTRATTAGAESRDMRERTTKAVRNSLPVADEGGYCVYPLPFAPPPPLATAWRHTQDSGPRGQQVLFIDCPQVRKTLGPSVNYGLPEVYATSATKNARRTVTRTANRTADRKDSKRAGRDRRPVDQLKLVRFVLAHRGLPDWPAKRLAQWLADHHFSSEGDRRQKKNPRQVVTVREKNRNDVWHLIHSIDRNLDFYRTGRLVRGIGDRQGPRHIVTLLPPDGKPYLSETDYQRIRSMLDENLEQFHRAHRYTFGHLPATAAGHAGQLVVHRKDGEVVYRFKRKPDRSDTSSPRTGARASSTAGAKALQRPAPVIPAAAFALSLVEGLVAAHADLTAFVPPPEPRDIEARHAHDRITEMVEKKRQEIARVFARLFPADDESELTGALRRDTEAHYEHLTTEVTFLERQAAQAREEVARTDRVNDPRTLAVTDLLEAVAALRDPENLRFHAQWREAITDLTVDLRSYRRDGTRVHETSWTGTLLIHHGQDQRRVPFSGSDQARTDLRAREVIAVVAALRDGVGLSGYWSGNKPEGRQLLRDALGVPDGHGMPVTTIRDPRLLRIAMAVVYPPLDDRTTSADSQPGRAVPLLAGSPLTPRQLPAAARRLGEPLALLKRVQAANAPSGYASGATRRWLCKGDRDVNQVCQLAAAAGGILQASDFDPDDWVLLRHAAKRSDPRLFAFSYGQMTLQPCPHCAERRWLHLDIREATEPVCGNCRHDFTGIEWLPDPYDHYAYGNHA